MNIDKSQLEGQLYQAGRTLSYPPTPDIAATVTQRLAQAPRASGQPRRLAWAMVVALLVLLGGLLAVPTVRAAVLDFLQIGAVRIFLAESPATDPPGTSTQTPPAATSVLDLAGETTLNAARDQADFPIRLPRYPRNLGKPDRVFWQNLGGPAVVLVWLAPEDERQVRMSLQYFSEEAFVYKMQPAALEETTVDGYPALWTTGPYLLQTGAGDLAETRLIDGHVLIWSDGTLTYRLETHLDLEEARRVAESLR